MSYEACIRIRVSILTPKAFSMRSAISPERSALPLSRLDNAGRETRSAAAAAVTVRPAGSIISVRMKSPGWGGFFIGMFFAPTSLVIVFQIHITDLVLYSIDTKCQTPVASHAQTPSSLAVACQRMHFPHRKRAQFFRILHSLQIRQHLSKLACRIGRYGLRNIFLVKPFQALMSEVPYSHLP